LCAIAIQNGVHRCGVATDRNRYRLIDGGGCGNGLCNHKAHLFVIAVATARRNVNDKRVYAVHGYNSDRIGNDKMGAKSALSVDTIIHNNLLFKQRR
jgi:hypothetical protein